MYLAGGEALEVKGRAYATFGEGVNELRRAAAGGWIMFRVNLETREQQEKLSSVARRAVVRKVGIPLNNKSRGSNTKEVYLQPKKTSSWFGRISFVVRLTGDSYVVATGKEKNCCLF